MNMFNMLKKAQEMQKGLQAVQAELGKTEVQGVAGSGLVTVTMTGTHDVNAVKVKPEALDDAEMLEDLLKVAFNDALAKANALAKQKMQSVTGGLNIPGL